MELWLRRAFGVLAIGGGFNGLVYTFNIIGTVETLEFLLMLLTASLFYGGGIWCGLMLFERRAGAERINMIFWLVQIPIIQTAIVSINLSSGASAPLYVSFSSDELATHLNFGAFAVLGSGIQWSIGRPPEVTKVGVNAVAIAGVWWTQWSLRRQGSAR